MKKDIYTEVTNTIIQALEGGLAPWVMPWNPESPYSLPKNAITETCYRGINSVLLWATATKQGYKQHEWMTFNQAKSIGANVRKGEKSTQIIFYRSLTVTEKVKNTVTGTEEEVGVDIPMIKTFHVFNVEQMENLPERDSSAPVSAIERQQRVEDVIGATRAEIHFGGNKAFYSPSGDMIQMPHIEDFHTIEDYYATILHELSHWTGHKSRLHRDFKRFDEESYAMEELVAEISSAFLCASLGVSGKLQHENYIARWIKVLKEHKRAIFTAAARAADASDYILNINDKPIY